MVLAVGERDGLDGGRSDRQRRGQVDKQESKAQQRFALLGKEMNLAEERVTSRQDAVWTRDRGSREVNAIQWTLVVKETFCRLMRLYVLRRSSEEVPRLNQ